MITWSSHNTSFKSLRFIARWIFRFFDFFFVQLNLILLGAGYYFIFSIFVRVLLVRRELNARGMGHLTGRHCPRNGLSPTQSTGYDCARSLEIRQYMAHNVKIGTEKKIVFWQMISAQSRNNFFFTLNRIKVFEKCVKSFLKRFKVSNWPWHPRD